MSIRRNFLNKLSVLLLVLLILACSSSHHQSVDFTVKSEPIEDSKVVLSFDFKSSDAQTILIDWDALSVYNPQYEKNVKELTDLEEVLNHIEHPQFVIENKTNQQRLFSDVQLFEGETMEMKSVFPVGPDVDTIDLEPNKSAVVKSEPIILNRLKISESDKTIRLHYLFKPTDEQKRNGFEQFIMTSNWFEL
jgi:hypothetical protein